MPTNKHEKSKIEIAYAEINIYKLKGDERIKIRNKTIGERKTKNRAEYDE